MTINKVCGSGLKAVHLAALGVRAGDADIVPRTRHAHWFLNSLQLMTSTMIVYSASALFRPALYHFHTRPNERELAARFGVARATLRQALEQLELEGRLQRRRGVGTTVAPPRFGVDVGPGELSWPGAPDDAWQTGDCEESAPPASVDYRFLGVVVVVVVVGVGYCASAINAKKSTTPGSKNRASRS